MSWYLIICKLNKTHFKWLVSQSGAINLILNPSLAFSNLLNFIKLFPTKRKKKTKQLINEQKWKIIENIESLCGVPSICYYFRAHNFFSSFISYFQLNYERNTLYQKLLAVIIGNESRTIKRRAFVKHIRWSH